MTRSLETAASDSERLKKIFTYGKAVQREGYEVEELREVLREILDAVRQLEVVVDRPSKGSWTKVLADLAKEGIKIALGHIFDVATGGGGTVVKHAKKAGAFKSLPPPHGKREPKKAAKKRPKKTTSRIICRLPKTGRRTKGKS